MVAKVLCVGIGGFIGAIARYSLSGLVQRHMSGTFPAATLAVNALGCLIIGALMCLVEERQLFSPNTRLFLIMGLLGSLTTFSTVGYETFQYIRDRDMMMAACNVAANVVLGVAAVALGWGAIKLMTK